MITAAVHILAGILIALITGAPTPIAIVAITMGLLPDLDTQSSLVGKLLPTVSRAIERTYGHRTITHSLLALLLVAGVAYVMTPAWWFVAAGSYTSHLLVDLLIGRQGIQLVWPIREWLTLTAWRDDGPAPRALLIALLVAITGVVLWPSLAPSAAALNPIAIATPQPTPTPAHTATIKLHFELPAGVSLSALKIKVGDQLTEGQIIADWERPAATPWPTPTAPAAAPIPVEESMPIIDSSAQRGVADAESALTALDTAQRGERAAILADQQRQIAEAQRRIAEAQRKIDEIQPRHEREQTEQQHAVDQARQALADAQAAAAIADQGNPAAIQRAAEQIHQAEAKLRAAVDAQDRMRTAQGIERSEAEASLQQAHADSAALPEQQRAALSRLDGQHASARILALSRVQSARGQAVDLQRLQARDQQIAATTATAAATRWQESATATAQAHSAAVTATASAQPTPAPTSVISRASGRIAAISAEERSGVLVVTLEIVP